MSDEDSLSELNVAPARLMPKSQSLTEHHRTLSLSAVHAGNTISTLKAHKVRMDHIQESVNNLEERIETVEALRDAIYELKSANTANREANREHAEQVNKAMASHGAIIGEINQRLAVNASGMDLKKTIATGVIGLLMTLVTAYCGYTFGHKPDVTYEPHTTHQLEETARKIQEFDPDNMKRVNK
jgi:chromosome segregation ATPase